MIPTYTTQSKWIKSGHSPNSRSGPYYYAYFRWQGKLRSVYLGRRYPADCESKIQAAIDRWSEPTDPLYTVQERTGQTAQAEAEQRPTAQAWADAGEFLTFCQRWGFVPSKGREAGRKHVVNLLNAKTRSELEKIELRGGWEMFRPCFPIKPRSGRTIATNA